MLKKSLLIVLLVSFLSVGCKIIYLEDDIEDNQTTQPEKDRKISVWTTYWDTEDLKKEIREISSSIENISYFAAYFDKDGKLFIPEKVNETYKMVNDNYSKQNFGSYLSIVNDLVEEDGRSSLKDTKLLYALLSSKSSVEKHIEEIVRIVVDNGYEGIEIDYEGMKEDLELWSLFVDFLENLQVDAERENLNLKVLLEPNFPVESIILPEGPEYTIMCYNLHGIGTKPGPKADKNFILNMLAKMKNLPGNIGFAMATGGFKFYEDKVEQLSERQAVELAKIYNSEIIRDRESNALYFSYIESDVKYEIWYSDHKTLDYWFSIVEDKGEGKYGLSLWRLGGNISLKRNSIK